MNNVPCGTKRSKMGARTRKTLLNAEWRAKIQASMLLNSLQNHVFKNTRMSPTQLKAAEILLRKCVPDLSAVEHSGDAEKPIEHAVSLRPQLTREEWLKTIGKE